MQNDATPKRSRIQEANRRKILEAALDVFSVQGFRGATLDQISVASGLSKPNILYYFAGKEEIHITLLNQLMASWIDPMAGIDADGDPVEEILGYVMHKLDMAQEFPRESRLFANEVLQGAPRIEQHITEGLKPLFRKQCAVIQTWVDEGKIAQVDPPHLIFSIWATTQHYADFDAQIQLLGVSDPMEGARQFVTSLYRRLLTP